MIIPVFKFLLSGNKVLIALKYASESLISNYSSKLITIHKRETF